VLKRKKAHVSRRNKLDDSSADAYVADLVESAAGIRLPKLFGKDHPDAIFSVPNRHGIGVTVLRTKDLT